MKEEKKLIQFVLNTPMLANWMEMGKIFLNYCTTLSKLNN
jgi:hypothetical protein